MISVFRLLDDDTPVFLFITERIAYVKPRLMKYYKDGCFEKRLNFFVRDDLREKSYRWTITADKFIFTFKKEEVLGL